MCVCVRVRARACTHTHISIHVCVCVVFRVHRVEKFYHGLVLMFSLVFGATTCWKNQNDTAMVRFKLTKVANRIRTHMIQRKKPLSQYYV